MQKRVRMVDIAEKMGVSTFTVSKALSGKEGVSEELRAEVRRVAEQMGSAGNCFQKHEVRDFDPQPIY